jgi:uncharacterized protein YkwD
VTPPRRPPQGGHVRPLLPAALAFLLLALPGLACSGSSPTAPGSGPTASSVEASAFARINQSRRGDGKGDLMLDPVLSEIARTYSRRMRDEGFFGHEDPSGQGLVDRLRASGITFSLAGENLANVGGASDPAARAHELLMGNSTHRANILDARYTEVGVGVAQNGDTYWMTQVFLRP